LVPNIVKSLCAAPPQRHWVVPADQRARPGCPPPALGVSNQIPVEPEFAIVVGRSEALKGTFRIHTRKNATRLDLTAHEIALLEGAPRPGDPRRERWPTLVRAVKELTAADAIRLPAAFQHLQRLGPTIPVPSRAP